MVCGGKGGVGKIIVVVNLGMMLVMMGCEMMLLDVDMGLVNVDVLLGLVFLCYLGYMFDGLCGLFDLVLEVLYGLKVIFVGFGVCWLV